MKSRQGKEIIITFKPNPLGCFVLGGLALSIAALSFIGAVQVVMMLKEFLF